MKKAQGISMNVIIIAAICLIVLIVVIMIFTGNIKGWGSEVKSCAAKGGKACSATACTDKQVEMPNVCSSNEHCCVNILD